MTERSGDPQALYKAVLLAAGLLLLGLLFQQLVTLMVAVLITLLIAIPIAAAATRLERRGIPRPVGALLAELALVLAFLGIIAAIMPTFVDQVNAGGAALARTAALWASMRERARNPAS